MLESGVLSLFFLTLNCYFAGKSELPDWVRSLNVVAAIINFLVVLVRLPLDAI